MDDSLILVIDSLQSSLNGKIDETFAAFKNIRCLTLDINDIDSNRTCLRPGLILLMLDACSSENMNNPKFLKLPVLFPSTPIISIIDTKNKCDNCLKCSQFSWSFIHAPLDAKDLQLLVSWFIKTGEEKKSETVENLLKQQSLPDLFIGESEASRKIKNKISKIASYDVTVLLQGETGTGKELTAKLIHYMSKRARGPFVALNCGTIPNELFENELFGHSKGAYTHADKSAAGMVQSADNGTLFLDEIESLSLNSQVKLLRFIEDKKYKPLGKSEYFSSDVRIIAASNKDLLSLVNEEKFREDLFYRLAVVKIEIPPLRERRDDIQLLTKHFVDKYSKLFSKKILGIKPEAMLNLTYYAWPGNVREMENLIQEAVIFCSGNFIEAENLNFKGSSEKEKPVIKSFNQSKKQNVEEFEKKYLKTVLKLFNGNISKASEFADKNRREFYRLINKYKIMPEVYRTSK